MKLTKSHLKQLIAEEVRGFGQGQPADDGFSKKKEVYMEEDGGAATPATMAALQKKMHQLYKGVPKLQGLDPKEIKLVAALIDRALGLAVDGNAATALAAAIKKLGSPKEEPAQEPNVA